jgi:hypothetical protein
VATAPVLVNAKGWIDRKGQARLDFDKHIRFVPSPDPTKWVMLTITDYQSSGRDASSILYCPDVNSVGCIDESKRDPSVATVKDPATGTLKRRIKHFSGYNVFSGLPCDPSPNDPDCIDNGDGLHNMGVGLSGRVGLVPSTGLQLTPVKLAASRAGYMLAWA